MAATDIQKPVSMSQKIDELYNYVQASEKIKKKGVSGKEFKIPWRVRSKIKRSAKKNKALVIFLSSTRQLVFKWGVFLNGILNIDDKAYNCSQAFVFNYKKYPVFVIQEWSVDPIGTSEYEEALAAGRIIDPQIITIRKIETHEAQTLKKSNVNWLLIIGGLIAVIAVIYFISSMQKGSAPTGGG